MKQKIEIEYTEEEFKATIGFFQSITTGIIQMFGTIAKMEQDNRDRNRKDHLDKKIESVSEKIDETDEKLYDIKTVLSDVSSNIRKVSKRVDLVEHQIEILENQDDNDITPSPFA